MSAPDGLLVLDKPPGWTSHDVAARARRLCATRRVGHAGTLDPMATGVLVLGVGRATRLLTFLSGSDKAYTATVRLGQTTVTDDAEGEVTSSPGARTGGEDGAEAVGEDRLRAAVAALTGNIRQVPSAVSAVKVAGRRSYARVRSGEDVALPSRAVTVSRFEVRSVRPGWAGVTPVLDLDVEVAVSAGTYVRALARDLGAALGTGGHLVALRRTRVGRFTLADAHTLADLGAAVEGGRPLPVLPLAQAARAAFPARELTEAQSRALGFGQRIDSVEPGRAGPVAAFAPDGSLVALLDESAPQARSRVVFAVSGS